MQPYLTFFLPLCRTLHCSLQVGLGWKMHAALITCNILRPIVEDFILLLGRGIGGVRVEDESSLVSWFVGVRRSGVIVSPISSPTASLKCCVCVCTCVCVYVCMCVCVAFPRLTR